MSVAPVFEQLLYALSTAANAHGHDEVFVLFPTLFVRIDHFGQVIITDQRRMDENKWVVGV